MEELIKKNELLKEMISIILPFAEADPLSSTLFYSYRLVRSSIRKNVMRVQSISVLNGFEKMSDSAMELTRNLIEDVITINFILSDRNPEALARSFFEYRHIQAKQDLDYYSKIPDYIGKDLERERKEILAEYKRVMKEFPQFKDKEGAPRHTWINTGILTMMEKLVKRGLYSKLEVRNMARAYNLGSRKVHMNATDLLDFYDNASWDRSTLNSLDLSTKGTAAGITSLTIRYFDVVCGSNVDYKKERIDEKLYKYLEQINA